MKTRISVALNIILVAALGVLALSNTVRENKYRQVTKVVLLSASNKIDAGNAELVSSILKGVPRDPSHDELFSMVEKLTSIETAEAVDGTSRSVSMISRNYNPYRVIDVRRRW